VLLHCTCALQHPTIFRAKPILDNTQKACLKLHTNHSSPGCQHEEATEYLLRRAALNAAVLRLSAYPHVSIVVHTATQQLVVEQHTTAPQQDSTQQHRSRTAHNTMLHPNQQLRSPRVPPAGCSLSRAVTTPKTPSQVSWYVQGGPHMPTGGPHIQIDTLPGLVQQCIPSVTSTIRGNRRLNSRYKLCTPFQPLATASA
jgi:hypothetical protein